MRKVNAKKYAVSLYEATQGASQSEVSKMVKSFVNILVQHKRLSQADKVIKAFSKYADEKQNIIEVTVTTAEKMSSQRSQKLTKELELHLDKKVVLAEAIDDSLLGGITLRYGDTVADGSVKQQLSLLAQSFTK